MMAHTAKATLRRRKQGYDADPDWAQARAYLAAMDATHFATAEHRVSFGFPDGSVLVCRRHPRPEHRPLWRWSVYTCF